MPQRQVGNTSASQSTAPDATPDDDMDVDDEDASPVPAQLSNTMLQAEKAERQVERDERSQNGNINPRVQHRVGKKLDTLTHRLVIERHGVTAAGVPCPVYYCIGCDEDVKNIARARSLPHAYDCLVSGVL